MSYQDDGGPAFPMHEVNHDGSSYMQHSGMSIRDYFAAQVMTGFNRGMVAYEWGDGALAKSCRVAYEIADAMLYARSGHASIADKPKEKE